MSLSIAASDRPHIANGAKVGLIAGWGRYPFVVAEELRAQGCQVYGLGVVHHADQTLASLCDDFGWTGLFKVGHAIRYFARRGVTRVTMAGKIHKVRLYHRGAWLKHLPDWRTAKLLIRNYLRRGDRRDDTLLGTVVREFEKDGITMAAATDFAPNLLVKAGQLTKSGPSQFERRDIQFGWKLAKEMGRLDVGQSVAVKDRAPIAVEAIEGTDACIRRAGDLCEVGGFTLVKVAKPQQDMRFDVPTIGIGTLETLRGAGARVLAIEAGKTILLDEAKVLEFANRHKIAIVAYTDESVAGI